MTNAAKLVVERLVDETSIQGDDDGGPSNCVFPREQNDFDTPPSSKPHTSSL